jgi:hypothetical protein
VVGLAAAAPLAAAAALDEPLMRAQSHARRPRVVERDATR